MLTPTQLGEKVGLKSTKVNPVLAELGWIEKMDGGWIATADGKDLGAQVRKHHRSGNSQVLWPSGIADNRMFLDAANKHIGESAGDAPAGASKSGKAPGNFREKFPATHRAKDGHMVRSKAEMLIDDWLYEAGVVHIYERKLPVEENAYCDFYIPAGKVYIEYWGLENDPKRGAKYRADKERKRAIYRKHGFDLIELCDEEVKNLDDHLPRLLLRRGIKVD